MHIYRYTVLYTKELEMLGLTATLMYAFSYNVNQNYHISIQIRTYLLFYIFG